MDAPRDFVSLVESRGESGRGSVAGRAKMKKNKQTFNSKKTKVRVYPSISKALKHGKYGEVFSTDKADRLYVVTKPTWGKKSREGGATKSAKGFTPGSSTPGASWDSIKSYGKRTAAKHGGSKNEGHTTGWSPFATGERMGKFLKKGGGKKGLAKGMSQAARIVHKQQKRFSAGKGGEDTKKGVEHGLK